MNWDDILAEQEYLEHHGILGMKWGVRRYQNPDGSLTTAGRIRYGVSNKYHEYKENKKRKVIQSGDIKTVLKNKSKLTDEEFEKAIARVERTMELEALRKKDISEKRAIDNAKIAEKNAAEKAKAEAKLSKESMKSAERIAKANAKVAVKDSKKGFDFDKAVKLVGDISKLWASYKTIGSAISALAGTDLPGIGSKDKTTKSGNNNENSNVEQNNVATNQKTSATANNANNKKTSATANNANNKKTTNTTKSENYDNFFRKSAVSYFDDDTIKKATNVFNSWFSEPASSAKPMEHITPDPDDIFEPDIFNYKVNNLPVLYKKKG